MEGKVVFFHMKSHCLKGAGFALHPLHSCDVSPLNAAERACVWSACIAVIAFGARKREP